MTADLINYTNAKREKDLFYFTLSVKYIYYTCLWGLIQAYYILYM